MVGNHSALFIQMPRCAEQNNKHNFVSALHHLAMSVGRGFDKKDNILFPFDHWQGLTY